MACLQSTLTYCNKIGMLLASATNLRVLPACFWPANADAKGPWLVSLLAAMLLLLLLPGCTIRGLPGTATLPPLRGVDNDLPLLLLGIAAPLLVSLGVAAAASF